MERVPLTRNGNTANADWTWPRQTNGPAPVSPSFDRVVERLAWSVGVTFVGAFLLGLVVGKWIL